MGSESSKEAEVTGQANTNVIVEQGMQKVDVMHTILLVLILILAVLELCYLTFRQYQKQMKRKYLERSSERTGRV